MALDQQLVAIAGQTGIRLLGPNCQGIINNHGLYQKARPGEIKGFADIDDPYEAPREPGPVIDTSKVLPQAAVSSRSVLMSPIRRPATH